eukprot:1140344-Pelagomonas_calceolata.AAC.8
MPERHACPIGHSEPSDPDNVQLAHIPFTPHNCSIREFPVRKGAWRKFFKVRLLAHKWAQRNGALASHKPAGKQLCNAVLTCPLHKSAIAGLLEPTLEKLKIGALLLLSADICGFSPRHPPSRAEGLLACTLL